MITFRCRICGDGFFKVDLSDFKEMREPFYLKHGFFICPDCFDTFNRLSPEEQLDVLFQTGGHTV